MQIAKFALFLGFRCLVFDVCCGDDDMIATQED